MTTKRKLSKDTQLTTSEEQAALKARVAAPLLLAALQDAEIRIRCYLDLLNCDDEFKEAETALIRAAIAAATN